MTIGDSLPYVAFWISLCTAFLGWLKIRFPRHQHQWKEKGRGNIAGASDETIGQAVFCVCEGCGEHKMFKMKV